jgi:predicted transglutaminase-like cysteine proteinase
MRGKVLGASMMRFTISILGVLSCIVVATGVSAAESGQQGVKTSPFMRVFGPSQPPYGFVRFCETRSDDCAPQKLGERRLDPTPERLSELDEINRGVNRAVQPATDVEIYGVSEYWTIPVNKGDCEDYALLKQRLLEQRGWPLSALLLTVVRDEKGEGHAVLTVRTAQGDFILDNKVDDVRIWNKSGYQFVMRQSYLDPRVWVSLDPSEGTVPAAIAGNRSGQ